MSDAPDPKPMNYQGNSHKGKKEDRAPKKVKRIVEGGVIERKKPLGRKFAEIFMGDDARSVWNYLLLDVAVPAAKNLITEMVSQGIERTLYGDSRPRGRGGRDRPAYTSYDKVSKRDDRREISHRARSTHDFREIILESRGEAEEVLDTLSELIKDYDLATVADLYEMVNITGSFQDDKWGWTDIREAAIRRVREGYLLDLPRPVAID